METFSALLTLCAGNSPVTGEFPAQRPVTLSFDVFFDLHLNKAWVNNRKAGDLRRHRTDYDVIVMQFYEFNNIYMTKNKRKDSKNHVHPLIRNVKMIILGSLLLTRINFNLSMDK